MTALSATPNIVAGAAYSTAVAADGTIYAWGDYKASAMGYAQDPILAYPNRLLSDAVEVAAGAYHTLARKADGTIWGWGYNNTEQLAVASFLMPRITVPQRISGLPGNVKLLSAGSTHSLALSSDGTVWTWGGNSSGQLGNGDNSGSKVGVPTSVKGLKNVVAVSGGWVHSLALDVDGGLWSWGGDYYGQLGDGKTENAYIPAIIPGLPKLIAISAGSYHSLALAADGAVWSWGQNTYGQLGTPGTVGTLPRVVAGLPKIKSIAAGNHHSVALAEDGSTWVWGESLGAGLATNGTFPIRTGLPKAIVAIAAGMGHSLALGNDGAVWAWGRNDAGQIGDGSFASRFAAVRAEDENATGFLSLIGPSLDNSRLDALSIMQVVGKTNSDLNARITDLRANGVSGDIYFPSLLPSSSPLVSMKRGHRDAGVGMSNTTTCRNASKQGPCATGPITQTQTAYEKQAINPLFQSNAVFCEAITTPAWSAKGQAMVYFLATGEKISGVVQCPPLQLEATERIYTGEGRGPLTARTISATIYPIDELRGLELKVYSWAVAPDGTQYMQTPAGWSVMSEPMQSVKAVAVPSSGPITLDVIQSADLSSMVGTLVFIGLGPSWEEVTRMNMAGQYYTVR